MFAMRGPGYVVDGVEQTGFEHLRLYLRSVVLVLPHLLYERHLDFGLVAEGPEECFREYLVPFSIIFLL